MYPKPINKLIKCVKYLKKNYHDDTIKFKTVRFFKKI